MGASQAHRLDMRTGVLNGRRGAFTAEVHALCRAGHDSGEIWDAVKDRYPTATRQSVNQRVSEYRRGGGDVRRAMRALRYSKVGMISLPLPEDDRSYIALEAADRGVDAVMVILLALRKLVDEDGFSALLDADLPRMVPA